MSDQLDQIQRRAETAIQCGGDCKTALCDAEQDRTALLAVVREQQARIAQATVLIGELADRGDCWFDHHGGCQAHGYLDLEPGETCPHHDAKEWTP